MYFIHLLYPDDYHSIIALLISLCILRIIILYLELLYWLFRLIFRVLICHVYSGWSKANLGDVYLHLHHYLNLLSFIWKFILASFDCLLFEYILWAACKLAAHCAAYIASITVRMHFIDSVRAYFDTSALRVESYSSFRFQLREIDTVVFHEYISVYFISSFMNRSKQVFNEFDCSLVSTILTAVVPHVLV